jgi:flagellar basal body-associated protein FliL
MRQPLQSVNSKSKSIEKLVSTTKQKEKKRSIEQILILCIVVFCLGSLYVVFTANNSGGVEHNTKRSPVNNESPAMGKDKATAKKTSNPK